MDEALALLRDEQRTPIAGATDLYVALNFGTLVPRRFVDIWALRRAARASRCAIDTLVIGALATYTDVIRSHAVAAALPMLVEAARVVGGPQIQNRGTIGGNIANASPAGDSLPVLAAVDAVVVLRSVDGERRVPFTEFYTGYRATVMRPDELIVADRSAARRGTAVVPKGRHARRAGDLEDRRRRRARSDDAAHRVRQRRDRRSFVRAKTERILAETARHR